MMQSLTKNGARALLCAALSGCLSIDVVPQSTPSNPPQDASSPDSDVDVEPDAGPHADAQVDAHVEPPPEDAGPDVIVIPHDGGDVWIPDDAGVDADVPEPLPECAQGTTTRCLFGLWERHGSIADSFATQGDYLYWIDFGSRDARDNYLYDGAIMRTRVGVWTQEQLAGGLDFYDEDSRSNICMQVRVAGEYVFWRDCYRPDEPTSYLALAESARSVHTLPGIYRLDACAFDADTAYCYVDGAVQRRDLTHDSDWDSLLVNGLEITSAPWFAGDGRLYAKPSADIYARFDLSDPERGFRWLSPSVENLVDVLPAQTLVASLSGGWIGVAHDDGGERLVWKNVAGPGQYLGAQGDWLYWSNDLAAEENRVRHQVSRTHRDGDAQGVWFSYDSIWRAAPRLNDRGMFVDLRRSDSIYAFQFEPFPAESGDLEPAANAP